MNLTCNAQKMGKCAYLLKIFIKICGSHKNSEIVDYLELSFHIELAPCGEVTTQRGHSFTTETRNLIHITFTYLLLIDYLYHTCIMSYHTDL